MTAYGGKLTYTIKFDNSQADPSDSVIVADVRMEGNNMTITYIDERQPDPGVGLDVQVDLLEVR